MKIPTAERKCKDCGKSFSSPMLGDFNYGLFVFFGEKGDVFGYFQALKSSVWDFMESVLEKNGSGRQVDCDYGDRLQAACAYFADAIKGERLHNYAVCPSCYSNKVGTGFGKPDGDIEVPEISHVDFLSLPEPVRRQKVLEFEQNWQLAKI